MMEVHQRRLVDGQLTYQYHKLVRALALLPLERRRRAVDIGAHVGLWSMQLVKHFDFVYAFEPNPVTADLWRWNVLAKNAILRQVAVGDVPGSVGLRLHDGHSGHTQTVGPGPIRVITIDSLGFIDVDFIKIDVEGLEEFVVRGAEATILRCRPLIVVEQKGEDGKLGHDMEGARKYLAGLGMKALDCIGGDYYMGWP